MLLVAIARREIQTEGLSSPPLGLGAAFSPLSQNKSASRGLAPLIPSPENWKGPGESPHRARGGGIQPRREWPSRLLLELAECTSHFSTLHEPPPAPDSLPAPLFSRCTFFRKKEKSHNLLELVRLSRQVKPHLGWDRWQRFGTGSAVGGQRPARGADSVQGRRENTSGRMTCLLLVFKKITQRKILLGRSVDANYSHLEETLILQ